MQSNSKSGSRRSLNSLVSFYSSKMLLISTLFIPFHSISASKSNQQPHFLSNPKLTVVAVDNPSAVFSKDQFQYGFGYDLVKTYAQNLNAELDFKTVPDNATALKLVAQGKVDFAMTTAKQTTIEEKQLTSFSVSCGNFNALTHNSLDTDLNWVFKNAEDQQTSRASGFICDSKMNGRLNQLASFYNRNTVKENEWDRVQDNLTQRLPIYKASFKQSAQRYDIDWHLLAAIGYQESYLKPDSVSPTGVRGLMMLTSNTAQAMGVNNRTDPAQSIQGGAKYFDLMLKKYEHVPAPDRHWFALAAYNMGPGALDSIQNKVQRLGKNPNQWLNVYDYLRNHQSSNARYKQAVTYVTRIRAYLEHIKTTPQLLNI
ncbi:transglycosylase SLT domain-containing protein [Acinetobacter rudis]|uniref:Transglycosylase SLT domain-containing protein n=1 Tax=Acinetobacter rudis CIP 110305 TaxID=421052 RepID=S3MUZ4_9GAMM|nr:transglycosylase SLT domain-containing protein [Acinetobacter rudis]EPF71580.1 hypothetical protein F945_02613 [Acinetobacter rudis CIP 110305]